MFAINTTHGKPPSSVVAAIGLGANLGDADAALDAAMRRLAELGTIRAVSSRYLTRAWGEREQPDFTNAVVLLETSLAPHALLRGLKAIEVALGRTVSYRWGPRAIDLDILTYGELALEDSDLTLPHRELFHRAFVLVPLAELRPEFAAARDALGAEALAEVRAAPRRTGATRARSREAVDWNQTLERVRSAAEFCSRSGLARLRVEDDDLAIDIRRTPAPAVAIAAPVPAPEGAAATNGVAAPSREVVLKAEFVGIVRFSHPAVVAGAKLAGPRELAYVESLGIRNPIRSASAGRVTSVFVTDGQPVEFGQPLFAIERDA